MRFYLMIVFFFIYSCMDASIAIKPVFDRFQSVVITSGVGLETKTSLLSNVRMSNQIKVVVVIDLMCRTCI